MSSLCSVPDACTESPPKLYSPSVLSDLQTSTVYLHLQSFSVLLPASLPSDSFATEFTPHYWRPVPSLNFSDIVSWLLSRPILNIKFETSFYI